MRRRRTVPFFLFAFSAFFTLVCLSGMQATGATAGPVLLGRLASAMFEIDRWTPGHLEDIEAASRDRARGTVEVEGLPIDLSIPVSVAQTGDEAAVRASISAAAGLRLYDAGRDALVAGAGPGGSISITEPVRWALDLLKRDTHAIWRAAFIVALVAAAGSGLLVLLASSAGPNGLLRGAALGAGLFCVASLTLWLLAQAAAGRSSTPLSQELARVVKDCALIGLRAGLAVTVSSLAALVLIRFIKLPERRYSEWPAALDEPA